MRKLFWRWTFILFAISAARGQNLGNYLWTNVVAFPGLPTFQNPVCLASPPGETNRLFVCEQSGYIWVITNLAAPTKTLFLNLSGKAVTSAESGLLGLTFHPGFATNGYFYVFYTPSGTNTDLFDIVSRFKISATNENRGDTNSETPLFIQPDRSFNHNAGDIHFGPDGYLYIAVGDEGMAYNGGRNAQHIDLNLFSGILRIDVDKRPGSLAPNSPSSTTVITTNYAIPPDNPFVGATSFDGLAVDPTHVRTEFWAVGLRNPWRFSFDPVTGVLYCGDVGEDTVEELNIITKGGNYGWATYEGNLSPPPGVSEGGQPIAQNPIFPVIQYTHGTATNQGSCIIGGVVYRGSRFPELNGAYMYADLENQKCWATFYDGTNATPPIPLVSGTGAITTFGVDPRNGDILYCVNGSSGSLQRIIGLTPNINSVSCNTTNIVLSGAGGPPGSNYFLLTSTNLVNWDNVYTDQFDALANFNVTSSVDTNAPQQYYRISR